MPSDPKRVVIKLKSLINTPNTLNADLTEFSRNQFKTIVDNANLLGTFQVFTNGKRRLFYIYLYR